MKDLTIMYISHSSRMDGAPQSLIDLIKVLKDYCRVIVVLPETGMIEESLREMEIRYYVVPMACGYGPIGQHTIIDEDTNFFDNYTAALKLAEIVDKENVDLIHSNTSVLNVGAIVSIIKKKPHIWHIRELLEEHFQYEFWDKKFKLSLLEAASEIITISDSVKFAYKEKYGINTRRIYNGIDIPRFKVQVKEQACENTFLLAGSFSWGKGQWDAVKAAELLVNEGINLKLIIVGGSGNIKYIWGIKKYLQKKGLLDHVSILEFQKDLSNLRRECTYSLTCSKMEALGRVTIEAMLAGNVVIGANTGGTLELIGENQERGYLYQQGNYEDLARVMKFVINVNDHKKYEKRIAAQKYIEENFNLKKYTNELLKIYRDAANQNSGERKLKVDALEKCIKLRFERSQRNSLGVSKGYIHDRANDVILAEEKWKTIEVNSNILYSFLEERKIKKVAIYGMGNFGCRMYDLLDHISIKVCFVMDKHVEEIKDVVRIGTLEKNLSEIDAVIVTVLKEEDEIKNWIKEKFSIEVVGLSEILSCCK